MDDKTEKRLKRMFTITWFLLLTVILTMIYMATRGPQVVTNNLVGEKGQKGDSIVGPIGPQGLQGISGKDSVSTQTVIQKETIVTEVIQPATPLQGPAGEPGPKGDKGEPGRELQLQVNPDTRHLEFKYDGDSLWNVLIPCADLLVGCKEEDL